MKHSITTIPIYNSKLAVIVTEDYKDLYKIFSKESVDRLNFNEPGREVVYAHTLLVDNDKHHIHAIMLNFNSPAGKITHGVIAHEALHVMNMLFHRRAVSYTLSDDEHASYCLEWIVNTVYKQLKKWNFINQIQTKL